jgi:hypothetical protein
MMNPTVISHACMSKDLATILVDVTTVPLRELPTSKRWRQAVLECLKEKGLTQRELNYWVGAGDNNSMVSQILSPKNPALGMASSQYVERISVALDIPMPGAARMALQVEEMTALEDEEGMAAAALLLESRVSEAKRKR